MIKLVNVSHGYCLNAGRDAGDKVLQNIDLCILPGEVVAIVGPSGSGKSTLLNVMGTLLTPEKGEVFVMNKKISVLSDAAGAAVRRANIGFIFQSFNLISVLSAFENITYPLIIGNRMSQDSKNYVLELIAMVGLTKHQHKRPMELSGGQQQRVAIARALVMRPKYILADEPTANLDSAAGDEVLSLMSRLNKDLGTSLVICTHDAKVSSLAARHLNIKDGRIVP